MQKKTRLLAIVVLLGGAAASGAFWWSGQPHQATATNELQLHGNVDIRQVQLAFNGSERITELLVEEGQPVRAGQILARLDTRRLEQQAARAAAEVEVQRQLLLRLETGTRPEEIRKIRAEAEAARTEAANARRTATRLQRLVIDGLASQEQADDAAAAAEAAEARHRAAEEALKLALAGPRTEEIAAARATLHAYQAQQALIAQQQADAELTAPAAGIIQERLLEPGDMANPQAPVLTLALTDPVWVRVYVEEPDLGRIRPGMHAEVSTDSFPDKHYQGWVGFISPTAEFTPKTVETRRVRTDLVYQVRVQVCNPAGELRLGMPASVNLKLDATPDETDASPCDDDA